MRTTLPLDGDVLERARALARQLRLPFKAVVNEALRLGLSEVEKPAKRRRYRTIPVAMGLRGIQPGQHSRLAHAGRGLSVILVDANILFPERRRQILSRMPTWPLWRWSTAAS